MILDMIQTITGRYILRPQKPQLKINFDSMDILTGRETLLALESLLAMNGVGITKIDSQFFKAVPASGMNVHVPIWIDGRQMHFLQVNGSMSKTSVFNMYRLKKCLKS